MANNANPNRGDRRDPTVTPEGAMPAGGGKGTGQGWQVRGLVIMSQRQGWDPKEFIGGVDRDPRSNDRNDSLGFFADAPDPQEDQTAADAFESNYVNKPDRKGSHATHGSDIYPGGRGKM